MVEKLGVCCLNIRKYLDLPYLTIQLPHLKCFLCMDTCNKTLYVLCSDLIGDFFSNSYLHIIPEERRRSINFIYLEETDVILKFPFRVSAMVCLPEQKLLLGVSAGECHNGEGIWLVDCQTKTFERKWE